MTLAEWFNELKTVSSFLLAEEKIAGHPHNQNYCKTLPSNLPEADCFIFTPSVVVTFCHH